MIETGCDDETHKVHAGSHALAHGSHGRVAMTQITIEANRQKENAMRNYYYFSHDANAHDDNKLRVILCDYGYAGYGLYWLAIETMRQEPNVSMPMNDITYKTLRSHSPKDEINIPAFIQDCITVGLFEIDDDGCFFSRSLRNRVEQAMEISKKRADAAKSSSRNRSKEKLPSNQDANDSICNANAEQMQSKAEQPSSEHPAKAVKDKGKDKDKDATKNTSYSSSSEHFASEASEQDEPAFIFLPLNDGTEYAVKYDKLQEWKNLYPAVDAEQALRNMRGWLLANQVKRKTKKGIERFINSWLSKEQDKGGNGYTSVASGNPRKTGNIFADLVKSGDLDDL